MVLDPVTNALWFFLFLPLFLFCSLRLTPLFLSHLSGTKGKVTCIRPSGEGLNSIQTVSAALASTVGTGNIVGTAQAIAMGGPGALFWMWIAAVFGFAVKSAEIWFGVKNRVGPMEYIRRSLGFAPAAFYAAAALASYLLMGNMVQVNAAADSLSSLLPGGGRVSNLMLRLALISLIACSVMGDLRSVSGLCAYLVPSMTILYLIGAGVVLSENADRILPSFQWILRDAFRPSSFLGAAGGYSLRNTVIWGMRRGAFSNESGLGTAAMVHALADTNNPDRHSLWAVFEVTADTLILCTLSALCILCSGVRIPFGSLPGQELMLSVFSSSFGQLFGKVFFSFALSSFAMSTVFGCWLTGGRCAAWLGIKEDQYRLLFLLCTVAGCFLPVHTVWRWADLCNILVACPNLLALIVLSRQIKA